MNEQVQRIIDDYCQKWPVTKTDIDNAARRVANHSWKDEFEGELLYMNWKRDVQILAELAARFISERGRA